MRIPEQFVSVHTFTGVQLGQLRPADTEKLTWTRTLRETSRSEMTVALGTDEELIASLVPWLHWISVWDEDDQLLWTGPILKVLSGRDAATITSRDVSALLTRTRCPITKGWTTADPVGIADDLWASMIELHNLNVAPVTRTDVGGDSFAFSTVADTKMLAAVMEDLVKLGLRWTVVAGTPILGPVPTTPLTSLSEADFTGDLQVLRDGTSTSNNVRLQGQNWAATVESPLQGLHLQSLVSINDLYGVSNIERAAQQYARYTGSFRDALVVPGSISLHPDVPVELAELMPGARFVVQYREYSSLMEIETVTVSTDATGTSVDLGLESVVSDTPEIKAGQTGAGL